MSHGPQSADIRIDELVVGEVNSLLFCSKCKRIFSNPVVNVECGHTFCKVCYEVFLDVKSGFKFAKCPIDSKSCQVELLVINRLIQDEVDNLSLRCRFNRGLSNLHDPSGCKQIIKFGEKELHESECMHAWMKCPNRERCPLIRKINLPKHLYVCLADGVEGNFQRNSLKANFDSLNSHACNQPSPTTPSLPLVEMGDQRVSSSEGHEGGLVGRRKSGVRGLVGSSGGEGGLVGGSGGDGGLVGGSGGDGGLVGGCGGDGGLVGRQEKIEERLQELERHLEDLKREKIEERLQELERHIEDLRNNNHMGTAATTHTCGMVHRCGASSLNCQPDSRLSVALMRDAWKPPFQLNCIGTWNQGSVVTAVAIADKENVYSADSCGTLKVWSLEKLTQGSKKKVSVSAQKLTCLALNTEHVYVSGDEACIRAYSIGHFTEVAYVENAHANGTKALACTASFLFSSSYCIIKAWTSSNLHHVHTIDHLSHWVRALYVEHAQNQLFSGSEGLVEVWDAGKPPFHRLHQIKSEFGPVYSLAVTAELIIIGTQKNNIYVYDVLTLALVHQLTGHFGSVTCMVVSPNQKFMVSGSSDNSMLLWCLEKRVPIQILQRHNGRVNCAAIFADHLISGSVTSEIKIFQPVAKSLLQIGENAEPPYAKV